jgi:Ca-activated chloride channel family protein
MTMSNLHFLHPGFLILLLLLPLAYWQMYSRGIKEPELRLSSLAGMAGLRTWRSRLRPLLPALRTLAFAALVIALARPQKNLKEESVKAEGIDIVLSMDLSSSMLAQDFQPNRLEVSKQLAIEFVNKREHDRIGLVVFAGEAFTQCPLTTDHEVVNIFLGDLQCGALDDGTAIGMGLATAVNRLKDSPAKSKVIILLTDGVNNTGYQSPELAAQLARQFGIKVYTIGVGSTGQTLAPVSRRSDGQYIFGMAQVEIDEALLRDIAKATQGRYFRATSAAQLKTIYDDIDSLEKTEIETTVIRRYSEEFGWFAALALLLLLLEMALKYTILKAIP